MSLPTILSIVSTLLLKLTVVGGEAYCYSAVDKSQDRTGK